MVTGDHIDTARAIALECGILHDPANAFEGTKLRRLPPGELDDILPNLEVMARSSPEDKYMIVTRLNGRFNLCFFSVLSHPPAYRKGPHQG